MRYYAIGDIHGQLDMLKTAVKYIKKNNGTKVICIGDYIDRGPDSLGVLEYLMDPPKNIEFICLKGNHEDMMVDPYFKYNSFNYYCGIFKVKTLGRLPHKVMEWMRDLKLFHIEGDNIFAHAYYDPKELPANQNPSAILWTRFIMGEDFGSNKLFLNHGHTPFRNGPEAMANRFNLDCSAKDGEQLCVGIYEEGVRGPIGYCMIYKDGKHKENIWA